jgi:O-antigen/teichoic acid export membrane protein
MGMKRFKQLFTYQVLISILSIILYIPLVIYFKINGYFYAFLAFNIFNTLFLGLMAFIPLKNKIVAPDKKDFHRLFKEIFSISIGIYIVKIIYTNWEKLGGTVLGLYSTSEVIGIFAFAMLYAKKILSISDAVTDVNLPVLSEKYSRDFNEFKELFTKNFDKVLVLILVSAAVATYWSKEIVTLVVGSAKYDSSLRLIPYLVASFVIYSILNIVNASVLIPAKMVKDMIFSFVVLISATLVSFYAGSKLIGIIDSMALAMALGSVAGLIYMLIRVKHKLHFSFISHDHVLVLAQALVIGWAGMSVQGLIKLGVFPVFFTLFVWGLFTSGFLTKAEIAALKNKLVVIYKKINFRKL